MEFAELDGLERKFQLLMVRVAGEGGGSDGKLQQGAQARLTRLVRHLVQLVVRVVQKAVQKVTLHARATCQRACMCMDTVSALPWDFVKPIGEYDPRIIA